MDDDSTPPSRQRHHHDAVTKIPLIQRICLFENHKRRIRRLLELHNVHSSWQEANSNFAAGQLSVWLREASSSRSTVEHAAVRSARCGRALWLVPQCIDAGLKNGADFQSVIHGSLIHNAVIGRNVELVNLLLDQGCDTECRDLNERTPLFAATGEILQLLLDSGANPDVVDYGGLTPLAAAVERRDHQAALALMRADCQRDCMPVTMGEASQVYSGEDDRVDHDDDDLLEVGIPDEASPVVIASRNGDLNIVRALFDHSRQRHVPYLAVTYSATSGHGEILKELVKRISIDCAKHYAAAAAFGQGEHHWLVSTAIHCRRSGHMELAKWVVEEMHKRKIGMPSELKDVLEREEKKYRSSTWSVVPNSSYWEED